MTAAGILLSEQSFWFSPFLKNMFNFNFKRLVFILHGGWKWATVSCRFIHFVWIVGYWVIFEVHFLAINDLICWFYVFFVLGSFPDGTILCYLTTNSILSAPVVSNTTVSLSRCYSTEHNRSSCSCWRRRIYGSAVCIWKYGNRSSSERCTSIIHMGSHRF